MKVEIQDDVRDFVDAIVSEVTMKIVEQIVNDIVIKDMYAYGNLYKSVVEEANGSIKIGAPYSQVLEFGSSKKFFPPVDKLLDWINQKAKHNPKFAVMNKRERRKFAYVIAKKFSREGFKPHPFVRPAIEKVVAEYNGKV